MPNRCPTSTSRPTSSSSSRSSPTRWSRSRWCSRARGAGVVGGARDGRRSWARAHRAAVGGVRVDRRHRDDARQPLLLGARRLRAVRAVLVPAHRDVPARDRARRRRAAARPQGVDHRRSCSWSIGAPLSLYHWLVERVPAFAESSSCSIDRAVHRAVVREAGLRHAGVDGDERVPADRRAHGVRARSATRDGRRPRRDGARYGGQCDQEAHQGAGARPGRRRAAERRRSRRPRSSRRAPHDLGRARRDRRDRDRGGGRRVERRQRRQRHQVRDRDR